MNGNASFAATGGRQGWTSSPGTRGTMNIIWSCAVTSFLCCWSSLIVNVPKPGSSVWSIVRRKVLLLGLSVVAPEIILQMAMGQWLSASRSKALFHKSDYGSWTLRHSFFVDMGGLHVRCPDGSSFPISARQLHYLIQKDYVAFPSINEDQIRDRNKVDGTLRLITLVQILFFMTNLLIRAVQKLAITVLELSTAAFVVMSIATTFFWFRKPADVQRCDFVDLKVPITTILSNENLPIGAAYAYTPLEFIDREEWSWSILWKHVLSCLRRLHLGGVPEELPVQRVQNTLIPVIDGWIYAVFGLCTACYFGILVAGWNYSFPTPIEQTLWRAGSVSSMVTGFLAGLIQHTFLTWLPSLSRALYRQRLSPSHNQETTMTGSIGPRYLQGGKELLKRSIDCTLAFSCNNSLPQDPAFDAPVIAVSLCWLVGSLYIAARAYLLIADVIELRSLPSSAYQTVSWATLAPFIP